MPTEEEINKANVELWIANDNYAALADRYNRYNRIFEYYKDASPETQRKAEGLMEQALADYDQLKLKMYAAEDRINVAQNAVNAINEQIAAAQQAATAVSKGNAGQTRRVVRPTSTNVEQQTTINTPFKKYQQTVSRNGGFVPNENFLRINGIEPQTPVNYSYNISPTTNTYGQGNVAGMNAPQEVSLQIVNKRPTLSQGSIIPQEIQDVRKAYGNDYLRGMKNLEKMGYTVFNQKAYDKYGNVYNLWH